MASKYGYMATIGADTSGLKDALNDVESEARKVKNELNDINKDIKLDGGGAVALGQKYELLGKAIEQSAQKLELLRLAEDKVNAAAASGTISEANQRAFQREIEKTENQLNKYKNEIEQTKKAIDDMGDSNDETGNKVNNLGKKVKETGKEVVTLGDLIKSNLIADYIKKGIDELADSFVSFAKRGITLASDLQEVQNVVDTTFGDGADKIYKWAASADKSFGMSSLAAQNYNGTMGAMLKSMGLTDSAVQQMSMDMVGLSGDMASFYNLDVDTAFQKIRAGISGETEPLKQLGINMSVANLEAYALSQGIETAYNKMSQSEQAILRYNYLMEQTADAQGDFAKTSDSFANQQRIMELQVENLSAALGEKLLPHLNDVIATVNEKLPEAERTIKNIGNILGDLIGFVLEYHEIILSAAAATGAFYGVMKAGTAITAAVNTIKSLTTATKTATAAQEGMNAAAAANPYVLLASAIAMVTVGLISYASQLDTVHNRIKDVNKDVKDAKKAAEESIATSETEIAVLENKAETYEKLREKENRTAGEEEQLKKLAEELQQYMPEGTQLIDEQTGAYNSLEGAIDGVVEAMRRRAKMSAYEDLYTELVKQQLEAENNLKDATERSKALIESGAKISGNPLDFQSNALKAAMKDTENAAKALTDIDNDISDLDEKLNKLYEDEAAASTSISNSAYGAAEGARIAAEAYSAEMQRIHQESAQAYEKNLQSEVENLDKKLALRKINEDKYYELLGNYLNKHVNTESELYYKQLSKYEDYNAKKLSEAEKTAKEVADAEKKATEEAEKMRVDAIKASWDKITKMHDLGQIDDEQEYKLKAQLVKEYCDENEDTWDSYYKWLYDFTKKKEEEISAENIKKWEENSKKLSDHLKKAYSDLKSQKEQVKKDLQGIDLSETVTDKDGNEVTVLTDLDAEMKKIDKYMASVEKLKTAGISESLLEKINGMNYADGSRQSFIDTLLSLSPNKLQLYFDDWEKLQEKQEEAAQNSISDKLDDLNKEAAESVSSIFGNMPAEAYEDGAETAQSFLQGILDNMGGLNGAAIISDILMSGYSGTSVTTSGNKSGADGSTVNGKVILESTPITINLNDKQYISTTIGELISKGNITGGNTFNL